MRSLVFAALFLLVTGTIYFSEEFNEGWDARWVNSNWKTDGTQAAFVRSAGKWTVDPLQDAGLQTPEDLKFYAASAKFPAFSNKDKSLVIQFTVKNEQRLDCGGGYLKILANGFSQDSFGGETPHLIMFGPDICGTEMRTHFLLQHNGTSHLINRKLHAESDTLTHQYTAVLYPNNTFKFAIDGEVLTTGSIEEYWDLLEAKTIKDPEAKKPAEWVDEHTILDLEDTKPGNWDDAPEFIVDDSITKPEDWNDAEGQWEPPKVRNPEYKGEWRQKKVPNPDYKGPWVAPMVPNPDYVADTNLYLYENMGGVGIEIWQVTAGTIFDNIFIGDSEEEAQAFSDRTFKYRKEQEPAVLEKIEKEANLEKVASEPFDSEMDFEPDFGEDLRVDL